MTKITTTINGIDGIIRIDILNGEEDHSIDLTWCVFDQGSTGFITSFAQMPIQVTDIAAEHFVRMLLSSLVQSFEIKPGDLAIINHIGEQLSDVQFLPPTFEGNEVEIVEFVAAQDRLLKLHSLYEQSGSLDSTIIEMADAGGIVDDFLSLVNIRASGIFLAVKKSSQ